MWAPSRGDGEEIPLPQRSRRNRCGAVDRLLVAIEKTLLDQGVHSSWSSVRDALRTHQVVTVALPTDDGTEIRVRRPTTPEPAHLEIYRQLGVPPTLMHTRKSVHRIEA